MPTYPLKQIIIPDALRRNITGVFGEVGREWLVRLPKLIRVIASDYNLVVLPPFPNLSFNYVAPCIIGSRVEAVLKLGCPNPELAFFLRRRR